MEELLAYIDHLGGIEEQGRDHLQVRRDLHFVEWNLELSGLMHVQLERFSEELQLEVELSPVIME